MFKYNGKCYVIDWCKYSEMFCNVKRGDTASNTTVSQSYGREPGDSEITIMAKEMVETRYSGNDTVQGLKYDSLKMILDCALRPLVEEKVNEEDMSFGQTIAINTLMKMGIIYVLEA